MKIIYYAYRDWAINILSKILVQEKYLINCNNYSIIDTIKPDLVFFIGWSEIIPNEIIENNTCICLHPSKLPKYRGGSPIQHQIINGEVKSAVSFFIMNKKIDGGDLLYQPNLSLEGSLKKIFKDIESIGIEYINKIILDYKNKEINIYTQDESESTFFKRRKESDSEIKIDEILNKEPLYLYNKIRALNDPYPNAFIKCKDGKKLYLLDTKYEK